MRYAVILFHRTGQKKRDTIDDTNINLIHILQKKKVQSQEIQKILFKSPF